MTTLPRIITTGSRYFHSRPAVWDTLNATLARIGPFTLIHGDCPGTDDIPGADQLAAQWATHTDNPVEAHPADWDTCRPICPPRHRRPKKPGDIHHPGTQPDYCPQAGPRRNQKMINLGADLVLAFPLNASHGTWTCIRAAQRAGIPVQVYEYTHLRAGEPTHTYKTLQSRP